MAGSQFDLLKQRRFLPFFITQALGAFNDNVYKNALISIITFQIVTTSSQQSGVLINLAAVLFILPFFLFSALAGQLAEKYKKSGLIRKVKLLEVAIMLSAAAAFYFNSLVALFVLLFFMGLQSTLFGPIKFAILPQHLKESELIGGNALIESGTFLAILIGMIVGNSVIALPEYGSVIISITVVLLAVSGYLASRYIPETPATAPDLKLNWNVFSETLNNFRFMRQNRAVFLSVLGISWFWFFGATILAQLPNYTKHTLGGTESVLTLMLAAFSIGIGLGSLLCEKMSGQKIEIGLVPLGAIGMTFFSIDLYFANNTTDAQPLLSLVQFIEQPGSWHVILDAALIGVFSGFFIVPLQAMIQQRCERSHLSRVIAGTNILNALFMVLSGVMAIALISLGLSIPEIILVTGVLNVLVSLYIFKLVPEFIMRFLVWLVVNLLYRIRIKGSEHIPDEGPCVLVCNHVSFVDALIIAASCRRPVRFVMDHRIFNTPLLSFIFRTAKAIPIASAKEDPRLMEQAFDKIADYLDQGEVVCIFPEGKITYDGQMSPFRPGIERIIQRTPVPVVPMALCGLWGSFFSRKYGKAMASLPRKLWARIELRIGAALPPAQVTAQGLFDRVAQLRGDNP
jgi:hypothetical protein